MPEPVKPNIGDNLVIIHKVISRAIEVSKEDILSFGMTEFLDDSIKEGFTNYLQCLVTVLRAHHLSEDELIFPFLQEKLPDAPYKPLTIQHQAAEKLLGQLESGIQSLLDGGSTKAVFIGLSQPITKLSTLWFPHIKVEERSFSADNIHQAINREEQQSLLKAVAEFSQQHSKPEFLVIPFVLFNLPAELQEVMSKGMPPMLVQQLVPIDWKDKWGSMKPFLLD